MAVPSSGQLREYADIGTELGVAQSNVSLRGMSQIAGFSAPDAMSEFYGYSPIPPAPSYVGSDFTTSGTGRAASLNVPIPSARSAGDLIIVFMTTSYGTYSQSNAGLGFTFLHQYGFSFGEINYGLYYKISDGTEPLTINFTAPYSEHLNAHCIVLSGTSTSNPIIVGTDITVGSGFSATHNGFAGNDTDANLFFVTQGKTRLTTSYYNLTPSDFDVQNFVRNGGSLSTASNAFLALRNQDTVTASAQSITWSTDGNVSYSIANQFRVLAA